MTGCDVNKHDIAIEWWNRYTTNWRWPIKCTLTPFRTQPAHAVNRAWTKGNNKFKWVFFQLLSVQNQTLKRCESHSVALKRYTTATQTERKHTTDETMLTNCCNSATASIICSWCPTRRICKLFKSSYVKERSWSPTTSASLKLRMYVRRPLSNPEI